MTFVISLKRKKLSVPLENATIKTQSEMFNPESTKIFDNIKQLFGLVYLTYFDMNNNREVKYLSMHDRHDMTVCLLPSQCVVELKRIIV